MTGNVLVLFDSDSLTHKDVVDILVMQGYLKRKSKESRRPQRMSLDQILRPEYIGKAVADVALQTAVGVRPQYSGTPVPISKCLFFEALWHFKRIDKN